MPTPTPAWPKEPLPSAAKLAGPRLLDRITGPEQLKGLALDELRILACEIRAELIEVIARNGGHLAPNMGVVELTLALHRVFDSPRDQMVWDVGHQAYVHKLLTGRQLLFRTLRQTDGCLGFLSRDESAHDPFGAGHAGTAISAALGLAAARDRRGGGEHIVAIVGDGSLNCGISLEALNHVASTTRKFIIVLNDNKMSISPNVGALARSLSHIIAGRGYNRFKGYVRELVRRIPVVGEKIARGVGRLEEATKSMLAPGVIFEELGIRYVGPIDGHDLAELIYTLNGVKEFEQPTIIHVITEKGRGYGPAEDQPMRFHGLACFDPDSGKSVKTGGGPTFSDAFGEATCALAEKHGEVVAITAAMCYGTGLSAFAERFPERFYDVGIAEAHAVVFAAGLAAGGQRPVVAIYATFLQRALDCVFHDVCLQRLPVIFCVDRAGIVEDGPTHHGIHDLGFLRALPGLTVLAPRDGAELAAMLAAAYAHAGPVVIRYPRAEIPRGLPPATPLVWGRAELLREGRDLAIWGMGAEAATALAVAELLAAQGVAAAVVNPRFLQPLDTELLFAQAAVMPMVTIEDHQVESGLAAAVDFALHHQPQRGMHHFGWGLTPVPHGQVGDLRARAGLTPEAIAKTILTAQLRIRQP